MGKLIAIWGAPNVGKTTLAVKLGKLFSEEKKKTVFTVFADDTTPALPVLFPTKKADDMYSIGVPLSKVDITTKDIEANTVTVKSHQNYGFLGYKDGENRYSYAFADETKCAFFLNLLKSMCDFVIVDCTSIPNTLSKVAMANADRVIRVVSPELKCICFYSSQLPIMADPFYQCDRHLIVLNEPQSDVFLPSDDIRSHFGKPFLKFPYCREIQVQSANGVLLDRIKNKKYNEQLRAVAYELTK